MKKYMLHNGFVVILAMTMHVLQATNGPSDDPWASWDRDIHQQQPDNDNDVSFHSETVEYDELLNNTTLDITANSSIATATNTNPDSQATEVMTTDDDLDDDLSDISGDDSDDESW